MKNQIVALQNIMQSNNETTISDELVEQILNSLSLNRDEKIRVLEAKINDYQAWELDKTFSEEALHFASVEESWKFKKEFEELEEKREKTNIEVLKHFEII